MEKYGEPFTEDDMECVMEIYSIFNNNTFTL